MKTIPEDGTGGGDDQMLRSLGYEPELRRRMSAFSNFAISLSIICILAGGITSFHVGLGGAGGAGAWLGWLMGCLFSMSVAASMAHIASAFPTAGGLYHWGSILGGRGCGWATAWFNLAGLVTVLATVNAGTFDFAVAAGGWTVPGEWARPIKLVGVVLMTLVQGGMNHHGIRWTTRLTDLSGWLILVLTAGLVGGLMWATPHWEWDRLWRFENFSGVVSGGAGFARSESLAWVFALGLLLPAYTITGFDASAHTSEETVGAAMNVPKGIVRSVAVSGVAGWGLVTALVLALPGIAEGVSKGGEVVPWIVSVRLPGVAGWVLLAGIVLVQFLCGMAALTSASRMVFAFARDGGLPGSGWLRRVDRETGSPVVAVWIAAVVAAVLTVMVPYGMIAAASTVLLYVSYVLPIAAGCLAWGRGWQRAGPWNLRGAFRPLAAVSVLGCLALMVIGVQPPNQLALPILGGAVVGMAGVWFGWERHRFRGPPIRIGG